MRSSAKREITVVRKISASKKEIEKVIDSVRGRERERELGKVKATVKESERGISSENGTKS